MHDTTKQIRTLAGATLLLLTLYIFATVLLEAKLPALFQEYLRQEAESDLDKADIFLLVVGIPVALLHIISFVGLMTIKPWAKNLFMLSTISICALTPFFGPYVDHGIAFFLEMLSTLCTGVLITLLYFTHSKFNKRISPESL
ncbi:MAG: hypothetical protein V3V12_01240 [Gammaproteobacteria bacterium]